MNFFKMPESCSSILGFAYILDLKETWKLIFRIQVLYTKEEIWGGKCIFIPPVNSIELSGDIFPLMNGFFVKLFSTEISVMW